MEVLLDFLQTHPDASEEDIAAAVLDTIDADVSMKRYHSDPYYNVHSFFRESLKLGEISVIRNEHLFRILFVSRLSKWQFLTSKLIRFTVYVSVQLDFS